MGLWAGIKYALNSTVGTSYFTPLNEILGRDLVATNNLYRSTGVNHSVALTTDNKEDTYTYPTILMKCNGSVNVRLDGSFYGYSGNYSIVTLYRVTIKVEHANGTFDEYVDEYKPNNTITTIEKMLNFKQGDKVSVKLFGRMVGSEWGTGSTMKYNGTLNLYADEVQSSLVEVI